MTTTESGGRTANAAAASGTTRVDPSPDDRASAARAVVRQMIAEVLGPVRELRCAASERLLREGVSMGHLHLMLLLEREGELTMTRLAELLAVSLSNATGLVDRMAERSLVERTRVPDDRRVVRVRITDRGRAMLKDVEVVHEDILGRVLARMDDRQVDRLVRTMRDVRGALVSILADERASLGTDDGADRPC